MKNKKTKQYLNLATPLSDFEKELSLSKESLDRINERKNYYDLLYKLRDLRKDEGLSHEEISEKTGIPRTAISNIESGKQNITLNTLVTIAAALGCSVEIKFKKMKF